MLAIYFLNVLIICGLILFYLLKRKYNYWTKKKVPQLDPTLILGNFGEYILLKKYVGQVAQSICNKLPNEPYIGAYYGTEPVLIVQDPDIIKIVLTKDFYFFNGREVSPYSEKEIITTNIFFTSGDRWKVVRQNFTPLFSSAKMKNMFYLIENCTKLFDAMLEYETADSNVVEVKSLMARYTMDCVGSCIFGVDTNTMLKGQINNPFKIMGELIFTQSSYRGFKLIARAIWPRIFYGLRFKLFPLELKDFFMTLLTGVFEARKYKATARNDFIDLLLKMKDGTNYITGDSLENMKTGDSKKTSFELDKEWLAAQCVGLFGAGYETSATTLSLTLYELAKHEDIQKRVIEEVDDYLKNNDYKVNYNCVSELPYLEACIEETMRLYPVLGNLTREVMEDYTFPTGLKVDKGVRVHIPVYAIHHNPRYFPEPEEFRPERFLPEERGNIKPYTYMPFGEGHRVCLGIRFAKMQMMAGLTTLFGKYHVAVDASTPTSLEFDPRIMATQVLGGINLKLIPRKGT